ncbi:MAG: formylglycine-generating enzyme family protein [Holophagales bacterium]|nr:formylglycine-generating enzyme family protein [Holophagales bacterium]
MPQERDLDRDRRGTRVDPRPDADAQGVRQPPLLNGPGVVASSSRPLPRSYAHVPRTILWLVPGGDVPIGGRTVTVEPFYLSKWPVTNEQYEAFDSDYQRSPLSSGDRDLAVGISWNQADGYCRWYAEVSRKPMRLPTRTEWLYACRGSSAPGVEPTWTATPEAIDRHCWHARNSEGRVQHPEHRQANDFGLHGMLGSVWEWVAEGPGDERRVLCGGSFRLLPQELHPAPIKHEAPGFASDETGFRVARSFRIRG